MKSYKEVDFKGGADTDTSPIESPPSRSPFPFIDDRTDDSSISYPKLSQRYSVYGWNKNNQHCYNADEVVLLKSIQSQLTSITDSSEKQPIFDTTTHTQWSDYWSCTTPADASIQHTMSESFTLPNREAKDSRSFPLWAFADNIARRIANWQSERAKHQPKERMNDPTMLVLEELKHWFSSILSTKDCKTDDVSFIEKRQSYLKNLIHLLPDFGTDRLRLHDLHNSLEDAKKIIHTCTANREMPQLLTDVTISGKSLENTIGTYLHFLLIDEEVADNFSPDLLEAKRVKCLQSPLCKAYQAANELISTTSVSQKILKFFSLNRFYKLLTSDREPYTSLELQKSVIAKIKFAPFVSATDKLSYLHAIATLESLSIVRKTLEDFHKIQTSIGTYAFAHNYLEKANELTSNYIQLIQQANTLVKRLLKSADNGLASLLTRPKSGQASGFFEKNLQALETRTAKGTTTTAQIDTYCEQAVATVQKYQIEMKKLTENLNSGKASAEVQVAMHELMKQLTHLNSMLPVILGKKNILDHSLVDQTETKLLTAPDTSESIDATCPATHNMLDAPAIGNPTSTTTVTPIFDYDASRWDSDVRHDPITHKHIFTYRLFKNGAEVGSAEFYDKPVLCFSSDKQQHNLLKTTGILSVIQLTPDMQIDEICQALPPTLLDRMLYHAKQSAMHGALRGGSNVFARALSDLGLSKKFTDIARYGAYYGSLFTLNYYSQYQKLQDVHADYRSTQALYLAALQTGQQAIMNVALGAVGNLLDKAGSLLERYDWHTAGYYTKKFGSLLSFGVFAYQAHENGVAETAVSLAAGTATQWVIEQSYTGL